MSCKWMESHVAIKMISPSAFFGSAALINFSHCLQPSWLSSAKTP